MNKLDEARNKINEIDNKLVALFEARMKAVEEVAAYKKENNLPIFDEAREVIVKKNCLMLLQNKALEPYYSIVLDALLKASKDYQGEILK